MMVCVYTMWMRGHESGPFTPRSTRLVVSLSQDDSLARRRWAPVIAPGHDWHGPLGQARNIHTHTIYAHAEWWKSMIDALALTDITLFAQDWGGFTSLMVATQHRSTFDG